MKIVSIEIENLASLGGKTVINFSQEPLRSAGIFAITGPTGSGKSTILDALCLALYGKTPRYKNAEGYIAVADVAGSTINQNDVRGILRDGSASGSAAVEFVGVDDQTYRATWSVRRARNKAEGNLQAYEMALKNSSTGQDIPGKKTELLAQIERLVGLNFEQITRSVLLAQGDFTAFLKAGKDEKSSLLEKLTGTQLYSEISKKVYEHHREEHQKLKELHIQSDGITSLSEEDLKDLKEKKQQLVGLINADETQIRELEKQINWHKEWEVRRKAVKAAEELNEKAVADKQEAKPREDKFNQVSLVQSARGILTELQGTQRQLHLKSLEDKKLLFAKESLTRDEKTADTTFKDLKKEYETKVDQEEKAEPLLDQAKALDVKLNQQDKQVKLASIELEAAGQKQEKLTRLYAKVKEELVAVEDRIAQLKQWKQDNQNRAPIAEHEQLILSKLKDAKGLLEHLDEYDKRIQKAALESAEIAKAKGDLIKQEKTTENQLTESKAEYEALNEAVSKVLIQNLENQKVSLDSAIEEMVEAAAHWKLLYAALNAKTELQKNLDQKEKDLERTELDLKQADRLLKTKELERETSLKMLEKAKLASAKSVDGLRRKLEPNEPCPVCGSLDHPFAVDHPALDQVLFELELEHNKIEGEYTRQFALESGLKENKNQLIRLIEDLNVQGIDLSKKLESLQEGWFKFKIAANCETQPMEERSAWLEEQLTRKKTRQKQLKSEIGSFTVQKEKLDRKLQELNRLEKELGRVQNEIKDSDRTFKSLDDRIKGDVAEKKKQEKSLEGLREELDVYFSSDQWLENWMAQPNSFVLSIKKFAEQWKANTEELDKLRLKEEAQKAELKASEEKLNAAKEEVKVGEKKLFDQKELYQVLAKERSGLFDGVAVSEVEARLKASIKEAKRLLDEHVERLNILKSELTKNKAQQDQLKKDMAGLSKQEAGLSAELNNWIEGHNSKSEFSLDKQDLISLLEFNHSWIEEERSALRAIDNQLTRAVSVLKDRNESLELHVKQRLSERSLEELNASKVEVETSLDKNRRESNEIDFKINEDTSNKQRLGSLLHSIKRQSDIVENWSKLNEIIGSADGKKFRQIAQEYTLDVLLSYSNVHLEVLSKRYILQRIPNSLGLQVLDQDMGDEVRTVYSLSGGESFLVSLSLALGLASLSSSRMKVESLFIDEGFGSLDPATLNIAMDALERLQNQGRKVGVISHVQEMTERIPVQIKVSKQQSGRSKVEVVGY